MNSIHISQLVSSPACIPQMTLEEILPAYANLGFAKFEGFSSWCKSHLDVTSEPERYRQLAATHEMAFSSFHLPPVDDDPASLDRAVEAAKFAQRLGASVVLFKANSRPQYIRGGRAFLEEIDRQQIAVIPVLQNHKGTPITTIADFREVIEGISDPRMKTLLEVGHFQRVGVDWRQGLELLGESVALVHINEIDAAGQSVPFGMGLVDFEGLFRHLGQIGYDGNVVVELELNTRGTDAQRTLNELAKAMAMLRGLCGGN